MCFRFVFSSDVTQYCKFSVNQSKKWFDFIEYGHRLCFHLTYSTRGSLLAKVRALFYFWNEKLRHDFLLICVQDAPVITVRAQLPPLSPSTSGGSGTVILPAILKTCNPEQPTEPTIMDRWFVNFMCRACLRPRSQRLISNFNCPWSCCLQSSWHWSRWEQPEPKISCKRTHEDCP